MLARSARRNGRAPRLPIRKNGSCDTTSQKLTSGECLSWSCAFITRIGPPQVRSMLPSISLGTASPGASEVSSSTSTPSRS